ncbi:MAG: hypothetical protein ACJ757_11720 [Gaiellaceae bacterium]
MTSTTVVGGRSLLDRLLSAYPLVLAYLVLLMLYAWQTTKHFTPWVFTDELEWASLSRGVAHHGVPELRLHPASYGSLYTYLIAPAWWLGATGPGYAAAKYINAAVMTASLFPGFALARLFVPRWAAIACGVATAAIPALAYTGMLIPESLAYFWSTLVLWLLARALGVRSRSSVALAAASLLIAPLVRYQLGVLIAAALIACAVMAVTGSRGRRLIREWSWGERAGAAVLLIGALIWLGAFVTHHSYSWEIGTHFHHRMLVYGLWAFGAFAIGVGVLPVFVTLTWLFGARFRVADERTLAAMLIGSVFGFGLYTAVKASYLSTNFAIRVEERNLVYIAPVVFVVTARWLLMGRARVLSVLVAAASVWYLLDTTPYHNTEHFYSDAPGLSILQWLNQTWYFTTTDARRLVFGILVGSALLAILREVALRRGGLRRVGAAAGALLAILVVGWNLTGEIAAANASNSFSHTYVALPTPPDWIDRTTARARTMFIGQSLGGSAAFWSLEFWNQSIGDVWAVDGSAPEPGPTTTPNYLDLSGAVDPQLPLDWIVAAPGVDPVGTPVQTVGGLRLFHVKHPIRIADAEGLVSPDAAWMSTNAWYYRFTSAGTKPGFAVITLSRAAACGAYRPSRIAIKLSRLRLTKPPDSQPVAGRLLAVRKVTIRSNPCDTQVVRIPARTPYRIDVSAVGTFQPSQYDLRQLSAQISFGFEAPKPKR